jgi:hypothetical protein
MKIQLKLELRDQLVVKLTNSGLFLVVSAERLTHTNNLIMRIKCKNSKFIYSIANINSLIDGASLQRFGLNRSNHL